MCLFLGSIFHDYCSTVSSLHISGCRHVFCFKSLCWVFCWNKKKLCRCYHRVFYTLPWKVCLYSLWRIDPAVSNQPTSYDELTLPWGWFVTSRNIFKPFYVHSCQSSMQTVYSISWPRGYWISTYKILCCAINIEGVMMVLPKPCRTNPALP